MAHSFRHASSQNIATNRAPNNNAYTQFLLSKIDETKKMHLPKGNASFCSANPDPKNAYTFGRFFGVAKNAEKRVQECQDWNYPGPRLSYPESI